MTSRGSAGGCDGSAAWSALTRSDLALARLAGRVTRASHEALGEYVVVQRPNNPSYRWGNFVLLRAAPASIDELEAWVGAARRAFAGTDAPHVSLRWDGADVSARVRARAAALGAQFDDGLELHARALEHVPASEGVEVRVLELDDAGDRERFEALNVLCDPSEGSGDEGYRAFRRRMRTEWRSYCRSGAGQWWGAFAGARLVAQCGLVLCPGDVARFQSVETHPGSRRRGICSALLTHVARDARERRGAQLLVLGAERAGPAVRLYEKLGFLRGSEQRSIAVCRRPAG